MPITADCHLHSSHSGDSEAGMEEMILRGIESGLEKMCFTEHMDFDYPVSQEIPEDYFLLKTDAYLGELARLREKYAGRIGVNRGVELGLQPHLSKKLREYGRDYAFDFVIASSHICNGKDPSFPEFFAGRADKEAYREYFESILANLQKFTAFDVYGHLDYVVRYGKNRDRDYFFADYREVFEEILTLLVKKGKGLELNTGGISYGLKELHPCGAVLKRFRELGGETVTVGSDAHSAAALARGFDLAAAVLENCGFKYYAVFEKRVASYFKV